MLVGAWWVDNDGAHMKNTIKAFALGLSLLLANVSVCSAQDFQKGLEAAQKGDLAAALREWRPLAEQGQAGAQYNLGLMYDNGRGVTQDYKEAVRLFALAAAQGLAEAQYNLGLMYKNSQGVTQDYKEAVRLYGLAAAQGNANAQNNLGAMYANGLGVTQDYKEAVRLYGLAAEQGDANAQSNLDALNKAIAATAEEMATPIASKLDDFRRQYPQYDDLSDEALTNALYAKFYSDIPRGQFDEQISSAVAAQGASDAFIRRIASTAALSSLVLAAFLSFLIFRFTAYRYWKKVRVTAAQNGIWCGGIFASMAPYPVINKMARDGFSEIPLQLVVTTFLFFTLAFACGYAWRKFKAAPIPAQAHNEELASDPVVRQQILDVAKDKDQLEIKPKRPVDDIEAAPNTAQAQSEETKVGLSGEIKMNALLLRPSLLAGVAGFLVPILMKPYGQFSRYPLSTWFDKDGLIMCLAGAIAAFALVEMYQRLRKP